MQQWSEENEESGFSEYEDLGFEGIFSAGRLLQGVRELRQNGPTFSHFAFVHDACMAFIVLFAAFLIVRGLGVTSGNRSAMMGDLLVFSLIAVVTFLIFRLSSRQVQYHS